MSTQGLFDSMYRLTIQLKGAPLKDYEKRQMAEEFEQASGSVFEKAKTAVAKVLHGDTSYIFQKAEVLDDVNELIKEVRSEAERLR